MKGWAVDVRTHRVNEIINKVLADPWPGTEGPRTLEGEVQTSFWWGWGRKGPGKNKGKNPDDDDDDEDGDGGWEKHGGVPKPESEEDCVDCFKW